MPGWRVPGALDLTLQATPIKAPVKDGTLNPQPTRSAKLPGQTRPGMRAMVSVFPKNGVTRGAKVTLHAHALGKSHDSILSFQWTIEVSDDPENATITQDVRDKVAGWLAPQKQTLTFVLLCSLNVTLTVSDRDLKASTDVRVKVRPRVDARLFQTTAKLSPWYKPSPGTAFQLVAPRERWWLARQTEGSIHVDPLNLPLGKNVCTLCLSPQGDPAENHHFIHAAKPGPPWDWMDEKQGFTLAQLEDPDGPFHHFHYVRQCHLFIDRTVLINSELIDIDPIYRENRAKGHGKDFEALVESVRAHEHLHGALMEEKWKELLKRWVKVEGLIHQDDPDALKEMVNGEIGGLETELTEAAGKPGHPKIKQRLESMGFGKPRTIRLPRVTDEGTTFRDFTESFAAIAIDD